MTFRCISAIPSPTLSLIHILKAAHLFLSENEIGNIKQYVPQAINGVPALVIAENENGKPVGFMGIADKMLEMIFISNESREQGRCV